MIQTTIMKTTFTSVILLVLLSNFSFSQTKLISHKSHSGSSKNFHKALSKNLFNIGESNFGMAPQRHVRNSKLDTVKLLSRHVAVVITSESCYWEEYDGRDKSNSQLWSAGTDTVQDHPVFNGKNSLKEVKSTLKENYFFNNPIDSVVFIGFDGNFATVKAQSKTETRSDINKHLSSEEKDNDNNPKRPKTLFLIFIISFFKSIYNFNF